MSETLVTIYFGVAVGLVVAGCLMVFGAFLFMLWAAGNT